MCRYLSVISSRINHKKNYMQYGTEAKLKNFRVGHCVNFRPGNHTQGTKID